MIGRVVDWSPVLDRGTIKGSDGGDYSVRLRYCTGELRVISPLGRVVCFEPTDSERSPLYRSIRRDLNRGALDVRLASRRDRFAAWIHGERTPVASPVSFDRLLASVRRREAR